MGSLTTIFSLYKYYPSRGGCEKYILLRTNKPSYPNYSQTLEDLAYDIEHKKRNLLLTLFLAKYEKSIIQDPVLIGELHEYPIGSETLYGNQGLVDIPIVFMASEKGFPWFVLGGFDNVEDFNRELLQDDELLALSPVGEASQVAATLVTENDFDLSSIKYYQVEDLRDI
ncbi:hypothetical protein [Dyadobacter pollutisoli]|uniref:Uncharacterized protein n=1 Tax=Dyadobacter pollutisoli TaxID=2910158 RepID=A0A9E8NCQ2_9BACT|nr:hypothetical protein [Dyadobacter pollutisoli]WAC14275.1 hypothetical protein ON006_10010 [Dyadobacter pollutisoli]